MKSVLAKSAKCVGGILMWPFAILALALMAVAYPFAWCAAAIMGDL